MSFVTLGPDVVVWGLGLLVIFLDFHTGSIAVDRGFGLLVVLPSFHTGLVISGGDFLGCCSCSILTSLRGKSLPALEKGLVSGTLILAQWLYILSDIRIRMHFGHVVVGGRSKNCEYVPGSSPGRL